VAAELRAGHAGEAITALEAPVPRSNPGAFLSLSLPFSFDPRSLLDDPTRSGVTASFERPDRGLALIGVGEAARVDVAPGAGPASVRDEARVLLEATVEGDAPGLRPRLLGGFRFNPGAPMREPWSAYGAGWLVLPRMLFVADGESNGVVLGPGVEPREAVDLLRAHSATAQVNGAERAADLRLEQPVNRTRWLASVGRIAEEVRAGAYEKAVLASSMGLAGDAPIAAGRVLDRLRDGYPECFVFSMRSGDAVFLGASPELLVGLADGHVHSLGLAGSTPRGATPEEDERFGAALMASAKDRIEHETVVRAIRERLEGATDSVRAPNQPQLRRFHNIQHLATDISGQARPGVHILDLVQRVHPTPAVCGWPSDRAREVIAEHESFDRGWYAGPVGWVDGQGDGEFAVALRSALLSGDRAWLFAGNGIMGDSDPESELAEVQLKFRPLAEALGA
jgi:isochorismate synthase